MYKNYPALCEALGIEAKTSNSKKKQLQEIESILKYRRDGNKYIIEEVYDQKRIVIPSSITPSKKRKGKHPLYYHFSNYVQMILMQHLVHSTQNGVMNVSMTTLCKTVGLLGQNYDSYEAMKEFSKENPDIAHTEIHIVKNKAYKKVYSIIDYSLKRLRAKRLIDYQKVYMLEDEGTKELRVATDSEDRIITDMEYEVLKELNMKSVDQVYLYGMMADYYSILNERLEREQGWKNVSRKVHIVYTKESVIEEIERLSLIAAKEEVNQNLISYLGDKVSDEHKKRYPYCHLTVGSPEAQERFQEKLPIEDTMNTLSYEECMKHFSLIAEAFIKFVNEDNEE